MVLPRRIHLLLVGVLMVVATQAVLYDGPAASAQTTLLLSAGGPYSGVAGVPITFSAQAYLSTGTPEAATYTWNFGDGTSASGQTVSHTYAVASTYTVTVSAVSFSGQTAAGSTVATVTGSGGSSGFTVSAGGPYTGATGVPVTFTAQAFSGGVSTPAQSYTWSFGDGGTASGQVVTRSFSVSGTYAVTVTAIFAGGQSASNSTTVQISGGSGGLTLTHSGPYTGSTGVPIVMAAQAQLNGLATAGVTYAWSFGDGTTGSGQVVSHAYNAAGTYTVTMTVTSSTGLTTTASTTAQVSGSSNVTANAGGPYTGTVGSAVTMTAQVLVGGVVSTASTYLWNFGDGTTGSGQTVTHTYATAGTFTVNLTVTTASGQTASASTTAQISGGGTLTVSTGGPYTGPAGSLLSLTAQASLNGVSTAATYSWSFGDGTTGSGQTATKTYATAGTYTVTVTATTPSGQTGSATTTVTISAGNTTEQLPLYTGCNNVSATWPNGTAIGTVAAGVGPSAMLESIWRFDNATQRFSAYSPIPGAPNDLTVINRNEPVFICMRGAGTFTRPA